MSGGEAGASSEPTPAPWASPTGAAPPARPTPGPWRPAGPAWVDHRGEAALLEERRRRKRSASRWIVGLSSAAIVLVVTLVVATVALVSPEAFEVPELAEPSVRRTDLPPGWEAGDDGRTSRLSGPPEPPLGLDGPHGFIQTETDGDPVTWDPCDPIRYVVNPRHAPPGADSILAEAIAAVEDATGLVFEAVGTTDEEPPLGEGDRPQRDEARYGEGWSPVLIAWTDVATDPWLDGYAGVAQSWAVGVGGGEALYISGEIRLLGDYATAMMEDGHRDAIVHVAMHELGHLVGLAHVDDPTEVMDEGGDGVPTAWGDGDLAGLAAVGAGECVAGV